MSPGGQVVVLEGDPIEGGLRNLFEIVSRRRIIRAARKAGVQGLPRSLRPWVTVAVIAVAIVITAALSLLTPLASAIQRRWTVKRSGGFPAAVSCGFVL